MTPTTASTRTPQHPPARRARLGRTPAFAAVGALVLLFLAASAAPSPLYPVWARAWGTSHGALTAVFALYALTLLGSLAVFGRLSDVVGRRPVLLVAVVLQLVSLLLFLLADGVALLLAARAAQGVATGLAIGTAGAALLDLEPPRLRGAGAVVNSAAPTFGLALGALGSGAVVEVAAAPARAVFTVLVALFAVLLLTTAALPETVTAAGADGSRGRADRRRAALRSLRPRVAVPAASRRRFAAGVPVFVATWALGALEFSLGPSIAREVLGLGHPLAGAALLAAFSGTGGVVSLLARRAPGAALERWGLAGLVAGALVGVVGLVTASTPAYAAGLVVAGAGWGASFSGSLRSVVATAPAQHRAGLLTSVYVVSYLAFSLPAVLAGELVAPAGLLAVAVGYSGVVAALALAALVLGARAASAADVPADVASGCRAGAAPAA